MNKETKIGLSLIGALVVLFCCVLYQRLTTNTVKRLAEGRMDVSETVSDARFGRLHPPVAIDESAEQTASAAERPTHGARRSGWNRHNANDESANSRESQADHDDRATASVSLRREPDLDEGEASPDTSDHAVAISSSRARLSRPYARETLSDDDAPEQSAVNRHSRDLAMEPNRGSTAQEFDNDGVRYASQRASAVKPRINRTIESDGDESSDLSDGDAPDASVSRPLSRADDVVLEPAVDDPTETTEPHANRSLIDERTNAKQTNRSRSPHDPAEGRSATEVDDSADNADVAPLPLAADVPSTWDGESADGDSDDSASEDQSTDWRHDNQVGASKGKSQETPSKNWHIRSILSRATPSNDEAADDRSDADEPIASPANEVLRSSADSSSTQLKSRRSTNSRERRRRLGANDSFSSIALDEYGNAAYGKALAAFNRRELPQIDHLSVGDMIIVPDVAVLHDLFPDKCPIREANPNRAVRRTSGVSPAVTGNRVYVVVEGDTLFDIARNELGRASRWAEIYRLNQNVLDDEFDQLRPGAELLLPASDDVEPSDSSEIGAGGRESSSRRQTGSSRRVR